MAIHDTCLFIGDLKGVCFMLSFEEKSILVLYKRFYNTNYVPARNGNTEEHIKAQKMSYLLSLSSIVPINYGFVWDSYGPFSPFLQYNLKTIDEKDADVISFYSSINNDDAVFTPDDSIDGFFSITQKNVIDSISSKLLMKEYANDLKSWSELLGSIAFIYHNNMAYDDSFDSVNHTLLEKKPQYSDIQANKKAWDCLVSAGIIF